MKTYKQLVAGDVRQKGDKVRRYKYIGDYKDVMGNLIEQCAILLPINPGMIGQLILPMDLLVHEYFRPQ